MMNVFKGEFPSRKSTMPVKVCQVCGDLIPMTRRAVRDWEQVQYCSAACRRNRSVEPRRAQAS